MTRAFVGLGANLGDREATLRRAVELLGAEPDVEVVAVSTLRETDPVGYLDQPRFLNGAAEVDTTLGARELLERLLEVERALGRERTGPRFGPRTVDLDLLLYGGQEIDDRSGSESSQGEVIRHGPLPGRDAVAHRTAEGIQRSLFEWQIEHSVRSRQSGFADARRQR